MKPSSDKPMTDRSKVSNESVPMSEKKGQFGASIKPMGIDMSQGEAPSLKSYSHTAGADEMEGGLQNPTGIGQGDGGPTIDKMGTDNPGHAL